MIEQKWLFNTYSIVAFDFETRQLGVAVQTHQLCVGQAVPWLLPGVGALATQSLTNISFGPMGLAMLKEGTTAKSVIQGLVATDREAHFRQLGVVDYSGRAAAWTGENCIPEAGHQLGEGFSVQANMMAKNTVIPAMAEAYTNSSGAFPDRLMAAMFAAQEEGGDIRGMQSAALVVVDGPSEAGKLPPGWEKLFELRVDEHPEPLQELDRLVRLRKALLIDRKGDQASESGDLESALDYWSQSRTLAPELEELPYWQAMNLADGHGEFDLAVELLNEMLEKDGRRAHWIDLIDRLQACGILEQPDTAFKLLSGLRNNP